MRSYKAIALLLVCVMILGCASIVSKSQYPVAINSSPDQADICITDEYGKAIYKGKTPTTVTLSAKDGYFTGMDYTVTFSKEGYNNHTTNIKRGVDGWYIVGNIFIGGLIGYLIVDPLTGAMWKLDEEVYATLSPQTSSSSDEVNLRIVLIDDIPSSLRTKMVRIK